jgi:hypothetical protein
VFTVGECVVFTVGECVVFTVGECVVFTVGECVVFAVGNFEFQLANELRFTQQIPSCPVQSLGCC